MTETTLYPSLDGMVAQLGQGPEGSGDWTWAALRAAGGSNVDDSNTIIFAPLINSGYNDPYWQGLRRHILLFDLSVLTPGTAISTLTLSLKGNDKRDELNIAPTINIYSSAPASNMGLVAGDFNSLGSTAYCDTPIAYADWINLFNDFVFNATGIAAAQTAADGDGILKLGVRIANYDADGATPTWSFRGITAFESYSVDYAGTDRDPKLVIATGFPTVITLNNTDTIAEKSTGHGSITNFGNSPVTQHGHVWSTSPKPKTTDSKTENGAAPNLGQFESAMTGLIPGTTYYVAAYAINSEGTSYGDDVTIVADTVIGRRFAWSGNRYLWYFDEFGVKRRILGEEVGGF